MDLPSLVRWCRSPVYPDLPGGNRGDPLAPEPVFQLPDRALGGLLRPLERLLRVLLGALDLAARNRLRALLDRVAGQLGHALDVTRLRQIEPVHRLADDEDGGVALHDVS